MSHRGLSRLQLMFLALVAVVVGFPDEEAEAQDRTYTNTIGMEFVLVPAGEFDMGTPSPSCPKDDPFTEKNEYQDCRSSVSSDELPQHGVTISEAFYLGKYEVTQAQWYEVMGTNPSEFKSEKVGGDSRNHPVENVSWNDVQSFIRKLNEKEGTTVYRLPTEAEWEYAARAGQSYEYSGSSDVGSVAWYDGNSGNKTHRVGQKRANAWGLYDMSGNVWEWVQDWYDDDYYASSPSTDPRGPSSGSYRVYRGGSWRYDAWFVRVAFRFNLFPGFRYYSLGFRLVRSSP